MPQQSPVSAISGGRLFNCRFRNRSAICETKEKGPAQGCRLSVVSRPAPHFVAFVRTGMGATWKSKNRAFRTSLCTGFGAMPLQVGPCGPLNCWSRSWIAQVAASVTSVSATSLRGMSRPWGSRPRPPFASLESRPGAIAVAGLVAFLVAASGARTGLAEGSRQFSETFGPLTLEARLIRALESARFRWRRRS